MLSLLLLFTGCSIDPNRNVLSTVKAVSANWQHSVAIGTDGSLWAWGSNILGEIGDGTSFIRYQPVQIRSDKTWAYVSAGLQYTIAIATDGTLWAWGSNSHGQFGNGESNRLSNTPIQIGNNNDWAIVSAGAVHTAAIKKDGTLWVWGSNKFGQLGDSTTEDRRSPVQIGHGKTWTSVTAGEDRTVAIEAEGTLWTWGRNHWGQLGDGTTEDQHNPVLVRTDYTDWEMLAIYGLQTKATRGDGSIWHWRSGFHDYSGGWVPIAIPTKIGEDTDWKMVGLGLHTVALKTDGTLWAWGVNIWGQLGIGTTKDRLYPTRVCTPYTDWIYVTTGHFHTLAIRQDGSLWAWGSNFAGQLGTGIRREINPRPIRISR